METINQQQDHNLRVVRAVKKIFKILASRNKPAAIEKALLSEATHEFAKISSLNKVAVSPEMFWNKIKLYDKLKLSILKPDAKKFATDMINSGDRIRGINYINSSIGRRLVRMPYKQYQFEPYLPQKNTYRKPGSLNNEQTSSTIL